MAGRLSRFCERGIHFLWLIIQSVQITNSQISQDPTQRDSLHNPQIQRAFVLNFPHFLPIFLHRKGMVRSHPAITVRIPHSLDVFDAPTFDP